MEYYILTGILGFILGALTHIRIYKRNFLDFLNMSHWDACIEAKEYWHLIYQGFLLGTVGSMFSIVFYVVIQLLFGV